MATSGGDRFDELRVSLSQSIAVAGEDAEDYNGNLVRRVSGPVFLVHGEPEEEVQIGSVELIYFSGSRAVDHGLDIVDVSDSVGQEEYEYARSVYSGGVLDPGIVGDAMSNDLLAVHAVSFSPEHRVDTYQSHVIREVAQTVGYHCGAVVVKPANVYGFDTDASIVGEPEPAYGPAFELHRTRNPDVRLISL